MNQAATAPDPADGVGAFEIIGSWADPDARREEGLVVDEYNLIRITRGTGDRVAQSMGIQYRIVNNSDEPLTYTRTNAYGTRDVTLLPGHHNYVTLKHKTGVPEPGIFAKRFRHQPGRTLLGMLDHYGDADSDEISGNVRRDLSKALHGMNSSAELGMMRSRLLRPGYLMGVGALNMYMQTAIGTFTGLLGWPLLLVGAACLAFVVGHHMIASKNLPSEGRPGNRNGGNPNDGDSDDDNQNGGESNGEDNDRDQGGRRIARSASASSAVPSFRPAPGPGGAR